MTKSTDSPLVSITMPVYNGARYLAETIDSIRAQTLAEWELIVVDDASTDESLQILESYAALDGRICLRRHRTNLGHRAASNLAFSLARGRFVARTDQDDISLPQRLAMQSEVLSRNSDVGLVTAGHYRLFSDGRVTAIRKEQGRTAVRWGLLFDNIYCHSTFMFRREFVAGPNAYRYAPSAYDYEICARLAWETEIRAIPDPLVYYRIHSSGLASTDRTNMVTAALAISSREIRRVLRPGRLTRSLFCGLRRLATGVEVRPEDLQYLPQFRSLLGSFQAEVGASNDEIRWIWRRTLQRLVSRLPFSALPTLCGEDPVAVGDGLLTLLHKKTIRPARRRLNSLLSNSE